MQMDNMKFRKQNLLRQTVAIDLQPQKKTKRLALLDNHEAESTAPTPLESIAPTPLESIAPTPLESIATTPLESIAPTPLESIATTPLESIATTPLESIAPTPTTIAPLETALSPNCEMTLGQNEAPLEAAAQCPAASVATFQKPLTLRDFQNQQIAHVIQKLHLDGVSKWQCHYFVELLGKQPDIELLHEIISYFEKALQFLQTANLPNYGLSINRLCFKYVHAKIGASVHLRYNKYSVHEVGWKDRRFLFFQYQKLTLQCPQLKETVEKLTHSLSEFQLEKLYKSLKGLRNVQDPLALTKAAIKVICKYPMEQHLGNSLLIKHHWLDSTDDDEIFLKNVGNQSVVPTTPKIEAIFYGHNILC